MSEYTDHIQEPTAEVTSLASPISPQTLLIVSLSLVVSCLALIAIFNKRRSRSKGTSLLLVGTPDAGKTTILSGLVYGKRVQTHASLQLNSTTITLPPSDDDSAKAKSKSFKVIDVPGHPRVRDQFREHLTDAKVVAFVIDAAGLTRNQQQVGEHLHLVLHRLTSLPPSTTPPSLLIVIHKIDLIKAPSTLSNSESIGEYHINRSKSILERELERRRSSQSGKVAIEGLGFENDGGEETELGGLECSGQSGEFKFANWDGGEVAFVASSMVGVGEDGDEKSDDADGLVGLREWLDDNM